MWITVDNSVNNSVDNHWCIYIACMGRTYAPKEQKDGTSHAPKPNRRTPRSKCMCQCPSNDCSSPKLDPSRGER